MVTERVAIVMGTGGPIDGALATAFAQEGIVTEIIGQKNGMPVLPGPWSTTLIDITNEAEVKTAVHTIGQKRQRVDYLVNGPDHCLQSAVTDLTDAQWEESLRVNLTSLFLMCKHVVPIMMQRRFGKIVHLISDAAHTGAFHRAAYSAAKAAAIGFSKALSREVAGEGITVNVLSAGLIGEKVSPFRQEPGATTIPLGRLGRWEEVADMAVLIINDRVSYVTGQTFHVNGGFFMP